MVTFKSLGWDDGSATPSDSVCPNWFLTSVPNIGGRRWDLQVSERYWNLFIQLSRNWITSTEAVEAQLEDTLETEPRQARRGSLEMSLRRVSLKKSVRMKDSNRTAREESHSAIAILDYQVHWVCCNAAERLPAVNTALLCKLLYTQAADRQFLP